MVFILQPLPVRGWTSSNLLDVQMLCGAIQERSIHFCCAGSGWVGRVWSARVKSLEVLYRGWVWIDSEIHSFSHWVIMTRDTEKTDSEIHSFSHWAIMTRDTERTGSEIHTFFHWVIITRAMERTDSDIHSPTELWWPDPRRGQAVTYIHFPTDLQY